MIGSPLRSQGTKSFIIGSNIFHISFFISHFPFGPSVCE
jgi:hypothetical protein